MTREETPVSSRWVHREDTAPHVLDTAGAGPPVVILNGLAGSAREFLPAAHHVAPTTPTWTPPASGIPVLKQWLTRPL